MATKKQRRRRAKEQRHEWETVYVDAEGNEVEAPEDEAPSSNGRAAAATTKKKAAPASAQRTVQPPSWRRVGKRGLLFAPAMFLLMTFLEPDTTILERSFFTAQLLAIFLPFSYVMDRMTYRMWQKRLARDAAAGTPAAKSR
jgi:hypothetical protein